MSFCTANGANVVRGTISRPRLGAWQAELYVDARETDLPSFEGAIDVGLGEHSFSGWAYRAGTFKDAIHVRVVGGAGGLNTVLAPKAYQGVPLRIPLSDMLTEAGEQLSPTADSAVLGQYLAKWVRMQQTAGVALAGLMQAVGSPIWRILDDGTLWIGTDTWDVVELELVDITDVEPSVGRTEIATDTPWLLAPGLSFNGDPISYVEHRIGPDRLRHVLWFEDSANG